MHYYNYNRILSYNAPVNILIGERGCGKSYGAKNYVIKQFLKNHSQFVYLRRYENELKAVFEKDKNKFFKNSLNELLPQKLIEPIISLSGISPNKKVNEITKQERTKLVKLLKNFTVVITDFRPINEAIVTSGGISIKEINPKTMESKIVQGLYFAGEIIDVDAYTGGFNLQIAYSTGFVAGNN